MASTEIEKPDAAGELAPLSAEEQALVDATKAKVSADRLILPAVKLTQGLTKEVAEGEVSQGHFFNALTKQDYGDSIELVVCGLFTGRFYSDEDNKAFAARGDVAPSNWPEEYANQRFVELDDAEERFKELVNEGKREWGSGPPISTTYNFVGLIVGDENPLPVRVSMMRGNTPAAAKIETLIKVARAPWDKVFTLTAAKRTSQKGQTFFGIEVGQGGPTPPEVRQAAVRIATDFANAEAAGQVELAGDESEDGGKAARKKAAAKKDGGLGLS